MNARVLLVEDDRDVRAALGQALELADFKVTLAGTFIEATDHLAPGFEGVVVTDMRMPGKDGMDLISRAQSIDAELPVIVLTGEGDVPMAVAALQRGAFHFLEKPMQCWWPRLSVLGRRDGWFWRTARFGRKREPFSMCETPRRAKG